MHYQNKFYSLNKYLWSICLLDTKDTMLNKKEFI